MVCFVGPIKKLLSWHCFVFSIFDLFSDTRNLLDVKTAWKGQLKNQLNSGWQDIIIISISCVVILKAESDVCDPLWHSTMTPARSHQTLLRVGESSQKRVIFCSEPGSSENSFFLLGVLLAELGAKKFPALLSFLQKLEGVSADAAAINCCLFKFL